MPNCKACGFEFSDGSLGIGSATLTTVLSAHVKARARSVRTRLFLELHEPHEPSGGSRRGSEFRCFLMVVMYLSFGLPVGLGVHLEVFEFLDLSTLS